MKCPKCQKDYDDSFQFCPYCGEQKPAEVKEVPVPPSGPPTVTPPSGQIPANNKNMLTLFDRRVIIVSVALLFVVIVGVGVLVFTHIRRSSEPEVSEPKETTIYSMSFNREPFSVSRLKSDLIHIPTKKWRVTIECLEIKPKRGESVSLTVRDANGTQKTFLRLAYIPDEYSSSGWFSEFDQKEFNTGPEDITLEVFSIEDTPGSVDVIAIEPP